MVYINFFFYCFLVLFAIIGAMRGWAKEMLVTFSAVLALFILTVMETYVSPVTQSFALPGSEAQFWMRFIILILLAFFGYQTPNLPRLSGSTRWARERLQDTMLGIFLGLFNGYLIVGTIWYWLAQAGYQPTRTLRSRVRIVVSLIFGGAVHQGYQEFPVVEAL